MQNDPLIGTQIGAYFIQGRLGEGGMAQVYKAYHAPLRREVAIKVISPQIADSVGFRNRFEREAQLAASLEHRSIVAIYDFGEVGNRAYLVMQYVGGGTLREMLRSQGQIEPHKAIRYAIQMARALHHAHQHGIVHRDVKPQNMLISSSDPDELLLSDFGIAKILAQSSSQETLLSTNARAMSSDPSLTSIDQMIGTAEYMAPEQINHQPVDARTDVYALGIVLFQMLSGQVPFSSTTVQGLLFQHVYTPPRSVREINPSLPPVLEQIIMKALAKAPEHRYQSAEAMAIALESVYTAPTHELPSPQAGNITTYGRSDATSDALTSPSQNRASPVASYYGQYASLPPANSIPSGQVVNPSTGITGGTFITPPLLPRRKKFRISNVLYALVAIAFLAVFVGRTFQPTLCANVGLLCTSSQASPGTNTSFTTEDFHNNDHNWTIGSQDNNNLQASISNNQYTLTVGTGGNTYFPHPAPMGTASGPLPQNFTLTLKITQTQGDINKFHGIVFRLQGSDSSVFSYAFVINRAGYFELLKYKASASSTLTEGKFPLHTNLNQFNTLQVTAHGNTFSFKINDQPVPLPGLGQSITDSDLTGGQLGVFVIGPNASFTVTSVVLTRQ